MDAVISGHAGVALILDGGRLASIHVENSEEVIPRQEAEIHLLFNGAKDLQFLADVDLEQVRAQLELAGARIDALHLALIVLDRELSEETRRQAALELNELLGLLEITDFLERVLYARPLPSSADWTGALELSFLQAPKVQNLLIALVALQKTILEVHRAWEAIPARVFEREGERSQVRALFAREGLFKELVLNREEKASIDSFLLSSSLRPALRSIPSYHKILEEWLTHFKREALVKKEHPVEDLKGGEALESLGELEEEIVASESVLEEAAQGVFRKEYLVYLRLRRHGLYSSVDSAISERMSEPIAAKNESDLRQELVSMLAKLPPRSSSLLRLRYGLAPAFDETSERTRIHESITRSLDSSQGIKPARRLGRSA